MAAMVATTTSGGFREALLYGWKWIQFAGLLHCTQEYVFDFSTTQGGSMEPSIRSQGCVLFYDKVGSIMFHLLLLVAHHHHALGFS